MTTRIGLVVVLVLGGWPIVWLLIRNYLRRRRHKQVPLANTQPYVSPGGKLPDFSRGQQWPHINPNRRSHR